MFTLQRAENATGSTRKMLYLDIKSGQIPPLPAEFSIVCLTVLHLGDTQADVRTPGPQVNGSLILRNVKRLMLALER